jgi:hypothetical protein
MLKLKLIKLVNKVTEYAINNYLRLQKLTILFCYPV